MWWSRTLPQPSKVLGVSLPRPMGVVLEEDVRRGRVVVGGFIEGSVAEKRAKVATEVPHKSHVELLQCLHTLTREVPSPARALANVFNCYASPIMHVPIMRVCHAAHSLGFFLFCAASHGIFTLLRASGEGTSDVMRCALGTRGSVSMGQE